MQTKKVLFLTFLTLEEGNGISNKIKAQVQALRNNGCETHLMNYNVINGDYHVYLDNQDFYNLGNKKRHFCKGKMFSAIEKYIKDNGIDILYFRYDMFATSAMISFFKSLQNVCKRIVEIPTYPYDSEFKNGGIKLRIVNFLEQHFRKQFKGCIEKFVVFVDDKVIYGVPTLKISNAVDINAIALSKSVKNHKAIRMIAVANLNFWHGYDRIIEGLKDYYSGEQEPEASVTLAIIGDGNATIKQQLVDLVQGYNLSEKIKFYGNTSGQNLNNLFDNADLAIGCLACHRKNITSVKALKNVEYAVRGIPFIYSEINDDFDDKPYVIKVSATDTPIDINEIVQKYIRINISAHEIRESVTHLTWDYQMKQILIQIQ